MTSLRPDRDRSRRGNYSMMIGVTVPIFIGFAALAVDVSFAVMTQSQAQFAADAASHAAYVKFRVTQDQSIARDAAEALLEENTVGNGVANINDIQFGRWDPDTKAFTITNVDVNAVRVDLDKNTPYFFGPLLGVEDVDVGAEAIVSGRTREIMISQDVTGSFIDDIEFAEMADLAFLDFLIDDNFPGDRIGMALWQRQSPNALYTPLTEIEDYGLDIRADWEVIADNNGRDWIWPFAQDWCLYLDSSAYGDMASCDVSPAGYSSGYWNNVDQENWDCIDAFWECAPSLGTRPGIGLTRSIDELLDNGDQNSFKAIVVVSDGLPNNPEDYTEATNEVDRAWDNDIHVWTVTYQNGAGDFGFMTSLARGLGTGYLAPSADELEGIMLEIAASIPVVTVQ